MKTFDDYAKKYNNFYSPMFKILVDNMDIVKAGMLVNDISVSLSVNKADMVTFSVHTFLDKNSGEIKWFDKIPLDAELSIESGYGRSSSVIFIGIVAAVAVEFRSEGYISIDVTGYDHSHKMMKGKKNRSWDNRKTSDIVKDLTKTYGVSDMSIDETSIANAKEMQNSQSDYHYIESLAKRSYYEFFVSRKKLFFRKANQGKEPIVQLEWGKNIISFRPEIETITKVEKVVVRGIDDKGNSEVIATAKKEELNYTPIATSSSFTIEKDGKIYICNERTTAKSVSEAKEKAISILKKKIVSTLKAHVDLIGIPELIAGVNVEIKGVGSIFSKNYYIIDANHKISTDGYTLNLTLQENVK